MCSVLELIDQATAEAKPDAMERRAAADLAVQLIAERDMPDDIRQFARSAGLEHWAVVLWQNAYEAGLRAAVPERGKLVSRAKALRAFADALPGGSGIRTALDSLLEGIAPA